MKQESLRELFHVFETYTNGNVVHMKTKKAERKYEDILHISEEKYIEW